MKTANPQLSYTASFLDDRKETTSEGRWFPKPRKGGTLATRHKDRTDPVSKILFEAASNGDLLQVITQLSKGGRCSWKNKRGITPLQAAAHNGHSNVVRHLILEGGANVEARDNDGHTALYWAAEKGHLDTAKELLETGQAKVDVKEKYDQKSPLECACWNNDYNMCSLLIDHSANVNIQSKSGASPIFSAAYNYNKNTKKIVHLLLRNGASLNHTDNWGYSILHHAAYNGKPALIKFLLSIGKRKGHVEAFGNKMATSVPAKGKKMVFELDLWNEEIDSTLRTAKGKTALDYSIITNGTCNTLSDQSFANRRTQCMDLLLEEKQRLLTMAKSTTKQSCHLYRKQDVVGVIEDILKGIFQEDHGKANPVQEPELGYSHRKKMIEDSAPNRHKIPFAYYEYYVHGGQNKNLNK